MNRVFEIERFYRKTRELGLIVSLLLAIGVFLSSKRMVEQEPVFKKSALIIDVVDDIPQTTQYRDVPAPSRPTVPIASEDEMIPADETIELTSIDFEDIPLPPPPLSASSEGEGSAPMFVAFDEPPMPIGGLDSIQRHLVYPEIARKAGIEGTVILHLQIDEKGEIRNIKVMKALDLDVLTEAAIAAVKKVRWKPARQRDEPITVWVSVPINFSLVGRI
jgi:protein TonB